MGSEGVGTDDPLPGDLELDTDDRSAFREGGCIEGEDGAELAVIDIIAELEGATAPVEGPTLVAELGGFDDPAVLGSQGVEGCLCRAHRQRAIEVTEVVIVIHATGADDRIGFRI